MNRDILSILIHLGLFYSKIFWGKLLPHSSPPPEGTLPALHPVNTIALKIPLLFLNLSFKKSDI